MRKEKKSAAAEKQLTCIEKVRSKDVFHRIFDAHFAAKQCNGFWSNQGVADKLDSKQKRQIKIETFFFASMSNFFEF